MLKKYLSIAVTITIIFFISLMAYGVSLDEGTGVKIDNSTLSFIVYSYGLSLKEDFTNSSAVIEYPAANLNKNQGEVELKLPVWGEINGNIWGQTKLVISLNHTQGATKGFVLKLALFSVELLDSPKLENKSYNAREKHEINILEPLALHEQEILLEEPINIAGCGQITKLAWLVARLRNPPTPTPKLQFLPIVDDEGRLLPCEELIKVPVATVVGEDNHLRKPTFSRVATWTDIILGEEETDPPPCQPPCPSHPTNLSKLYPICYFYNDDPAEMPSLPPYEEGISYPTCYFYKKVEKEHIASVEIGWFPVMKVPVANIITCDDKQPTPARVTTWAEIILALEKKYPLYNSILAEAEPVEDGVVSICKKPIMTVPVAEVTVNDEQDSTFSRVTTWAEIIFGQEMKYPPPCPTQMTFLCPPDCSIEEMVKRAPPNVSINNVPPSLKIPVVEVTTCEGIDPKEPTFSRMTTWSEITLKQEMKYPPNDPELAQTKVVEKDSIRTVRCGWKTWREIIFEALETKEE